MRVLVIVARKEPMVEQSAWSATGGTRAETRPRLSLRARAGRPLTCRWPVSVPAQALPAVLAPVGLHQPPAAQHATQVGIAVILCTTVAVLTLVYCAGAG